MIVKNLFENTMRQFMGEERSIDTQLEALKMFQCPTKNLQLYLSRATLPYMTPGPTAPPFSLDEKYKVHRNHLQIRVQEHRSWFIKVMSAKDPTAFSNATLKFAKSFPSWPLDTPSEEADTGYAFTVPAFDFRMRETPLPHPTNLLEIMTWINALPMQTMTRALHAVFPEQTGSWDVTTVSDKDPDEALWKMLVWRKTPSASRLDQFYRAPPPDPLETCSMLIVVQPPWILSPGDIHAFVKSRSMSPFNVWDPEADVPMCGAQRMWAKLWDNCIKRKCHQWVVTTYFGWIFGAFSPGFTIGQVYSVLSHDNYEPTVLEALTYHVACSMGIVEAKLPQALEGPRHVIDWKKIEIPEPVADPDMEFPDSESEWEGCDEEPGISAGMSQYSIMNLSAFGSEQNFSAPPVQLPRHPNRTGDPPSSSQEDTLISVASLRVTRGIQRWNGRIENGHRELPPIPERPRSASPGAVSSDTSVYASLRRSLLSPSSQPPTVIETCVDDANDPLMEIVVTAGTRVHLGLGTISGQGPVESW